MIEWFILCAAVLRLSFVTSTTPVPLQNYCDPSSYFLPQYGNPDDCTSYIRCVGVQPTLFQCQNGTRWSGFHGGCVESFKELDTCTQENALRECSRGATDLIPHPRACQRYYNCSDPAPRGLRDFFGRYEDECPYPQLFDATEKKCKPFKEVNCGPLRVAGRDGCDYLRNLCRFSHCQPCQSRYPSCCGLHDGRNAHPNYLWTPIYMECDEGRMINRGNCPMHGPTGSTGYFSPITRTCVSIWEVPRSTGYGLAPSCDGKSAGKHPTDERPDIYYSCPEAQVFYCPPGTSFNVISQMCQP